MPIRQHRSVILWLIICTGMVAMMMLIGAVTRLTESGLSMVEWRPLIGALPPFSAAEWERVFELYRATSEYRLENAGMTIAEFKTIFWWEYIHRLWGRLIGLVFGLPMIWFFWRGAVPRELRPHLVVLFVLGGLQGLIGWWMVKSGFVDRHDVSQYRLTVHLAMAFLILGYLLWLIADLAQGDESSPSRSALLRWMTTGYLALTSVTVMSGGLVAGLGAGFAYNDWPLIDGAFVPAGLFAAEPWWLAAFEDILTVQFDHRMLAYVTVISAVLLYLAGRRLAETTRQRRTLALVALAAVLQLGLGVATILSVVATPIAVLHQAGAILVFSAAIFARHAAR